MARKILITGGAGFIGSTIADLFVASGWDVVVLDNLSSGKRENLPAACRFYQCEVQSPAAIDVLVKEQPEVVCHHAAQIDVRKSMANPLFDCDVNLGGILNVMEGAVKAGSMHYTRWASATAARRSSGAPVVALRSCQGSQRALSRCLSRRS